MATCPKIPMLREEVPQQRSYLIVGISDRPNGFVGKCDYVEKMPGDVRPKGSPRNTTYLGASEWADGPGNSRFDAYYLSRRGKYWLLWNYWLDENAWPERRRWTLYGYAKYGATDPESIAANLLVDAWSAEAKHLGLGHYLLIDEPGLLSIHQFSAIAKHVWPASKRRGP